MAIQALVLCRSATEDNEQSDSNYLTWTIRTTTLYIRSSDEPVEMVAFMAIVPPSIGSNRYRLRQTKIASDDWDLVPGFLEESFEVQTCKSVYYSAFPIALIAQAPGLYAVEVWEEKGSSLAGVGVECELSARYMFHVLPK